MTSVVLTLQAHVVDVTVNKFMRVKVCQSSSSLPKQYLFKGTKINTMAGLTSLMRSETPRSALVERYVKIVPLDIHGDTIATILVAENARESIPSIGSIFACLS